MNNLKAKLKKAGGFTLIEMLIVVAIIAILIAIGIPLVNKALERAREATDAANERSALGLAMVEVMTENTLGGEDIDPTKSISAYYQIAKSGASGAANMGTLVKTDGATPGDEGLDYGKGTALGDISDVHTGQCIMVTYDPTKTTEKDQFTIKWMPETTSP